MTALLLSRSFRCSAFAIEDFPADEGFQHLFVVGDVDKIVLFIRFSDRIEDQPFRFHASPFPNGCIGFLLHCF